MALNLTCKRISGELAFGPKEIGDSHLREQTVLVLAPIPAFPSLTSHNDNHGFKVSCNEKIRSIAHRQGLFVT